MLLMHKVLKVKGTFVAHIKPQKDLGINSVLFTDLFKGQIQPCEHPNGNP